MSNDSAQIAQQLLRAGRVREAENAFRAVLEKNPADLDALNALGLSALGRGDAQEGVRLLERAVAAHPDSAISHHHLGRAQEMQGNLAGAAASEQQAVRLDGDFYIARLHLASLLEKTGSIQAALFQYARALKDAQERGRLVSPDTTPRHLQPLVAAAAAKVRSSRRAMLDAILTPLVAKYSSASLGRIIRSVRIYLHDEARSYPDPRQRPTFLYIPDVPATPYLSERSLLPWRDGFEAQTADVLQELKAILINADGRERVFTTDALERQNLRGDEIAAPSWNGYYFYRYGEKRVENCTRCPVTAAALETLPVIRIPAHGPEILFSVFTPGTHLLPHNGVTNARMVAHLPLIVPQNCALSVAGELHEWREGEIVVFDDTYAHEAWNRGDGLRVVLIFDIWNPYLSEVEQLAVRDVICALGDFREALDGS